MSVNKRSLIHWATEEAIRADQIAKRIRNNAGKLSGLRKGRTIIGHDLSMGATTLKSATYKIDCLMEKGISLINKDTKECLYIPWMNYLRCADWKLWS